MAAPTSFDKNGRTHRNCIPQGDGFETISQGIKTSRPSSKNKNEELLVIEEPKFEKETRENRENKSQRKMNSAKKVREMLENTQLIKFSNSPKEQISLNYFDDEILLDEITAKNNVDTAGPENEFPPDRVENFYVSPSQSPTPEIEINVSEKTSRVRKIRVSTASVSSVVRTKSTKTKKRSLSFYSIRGVSLQTVPENEELSNFLVYHQIKSSRSSTISELLRQINKKV